MSKTKSTLKLLVSFISTGIILSLIVAMSQPSLANSPSPLSILLSLALGVSFGAINYVLVKVLLLNRLEQLSRYSATLSNKDIEHTFHTDRNDITSGIADNLNNIKHNLHSVARELSEQSTTVDQCLDQLNKLYEKSGNTIGNQLAHVGGAMERMTLCSNQVSNYTSEAVSASDAANAQGNEAKVITVEAMGAVDNLALRVADSVAVIRELKQETDNISNMLTIISAIAEQTNLLALNAAIEAARAGEQGRGFAVVADEVRNLATRTQESTNEITQIITRLQESAGRAVDAMEQGQQQAELGVELTERTAEALAEISGSLSVMVTVNHQIAESAKEQNAIAQSVNENLHTISASAEIDSHKQQKFNQACAQLEECSNKLKGIASDYLA